MNRRLHSFIKMALLMVLLHTGLEMSGQKLYWTKNNPSEIESINFDGTAMTFHYTAGGPATFRGLEIDVANQKMYWYDEHQAAFMKANLDGTNAVILIANVDFATGMSIDFINQKLYWSTYTTIDNINYIGIIEKANLDGSGRTVVLSSDGYSNFHNIKVDSTHQKLYWFDQYNFKISRSNIDGTNLETFLEAYYPRMVIDEANSKLYFTSSDPISGDIAIESINLDGSSRTFLVGGYFVWDVYSLALDKINNKIYYLDSVNYEIKRVNTDGTGNEIWRNNMINIEALNIPDAAAVNISSNPSNASVCQGDTASFSITASGATSYQWEVYNGSSFAPISDGGVYSGATTATLTITEAASEMNGATYRCIASANSFLDTTSQTATLTVTANVTYYEDFDGDGYGNATVTTLSCSGAPGGFVANDLDCNDNDVTVYPGAVEICGDGIDNNCDGNIDEGCPIVYHPQRTTTICLGENASLWITAQSGFTYQWQLFNGLDYSNIANGELYSGTDTAALTIINPSEEISGQAYRCAISGIEDETPFTFFTDPGVVNVRGEMIMMSQPQSYEACRQEEVRFYAYATSGAYFQWQVNDGSGFVNLENGIAPSGGSYRGVDTWEMYVNNLTLDMTGYTYRCIISNGCFPEVTSDAAELTIIQSQENIVYYEDNDGDGYGNPDTAFAYCYLFEDMEGYVFNGDDCDDSDPNVFPGSGTEEICGDGIDNDCDGEVDEDCEFCQTTSTWDGTDWIPTAPSIESKVVFMADYTSTDLLLACSVEVMDNVTVTIASDNTLAVFTNVEVHPLGQLIFNNNASLIQHPEVTVNENTGNITFHRDSNALYNLDYTLWSSPTSGTQSLKDFSNGTLDANFFVYNTALSAYSNYLSQSGIFGGNPNAVGFTPGKGYLVRMPAGLPAGSTSVFNGVFQGIPNNGDISIPLSTEGGRFNAVGNPYPSPINIRAFIEVNEEQMDNGTLYFWRKTNLAPTATYVTVTNMGSAAVDQPTDSSELFTGNPSDWVIQPGQGFLFKASSTANELNFNNMMRTFSTEGPFFRQAVTPVDETTNELSRLWLDISNNGTSFGQTVIGYSANTTNGLDFGWDGRLYNDSDLSVYTKSEEAKLAIQARASFTAEDAVPLSYKANNGGTLTLKLSNHDGLFTGDQQVYLKDNVFNIYHDLKAGDYTFSTEAGIFESRFEVVYQNATLGTDNPVFDANNVIIYKDGSTLNIDAGRVTMKQVDIYDVRGRLLYSASDVNATTFAISELAVAQQVLVVQITTEDNARTSKKIIY
ncbi:MopE-related protein [Flavobacterium sp. PLA-1-15]|uniref:MopE-related protein n=1 Tax=Flavobacterium sp. PLA-1-15 TaxID=3380533 RepID=UPI003B8024C8